jgi:transcriptional regulator with XRE-family HTH domain
MLEQPAFGHRLRELRRERGLSQAALADGELSTGYLSRLESGARPPTRRVVQHLAKRLGVAPAEFEASSSSPLANILAVITSAPDADQVESLVDALAAGKDLDPALRWQALWLLAGTRGDQGRLREQHDLLAELVALSDEIGVPELRVRALSQLSHCARKLGDGAAARQHAVNALELASTVSVADRADALHALVPAEAEAGRLTEAAAHADELCELTERSGGAMAAEALWASATVRIRQADYTGARRLLDRALQLLDSHTDLILWLRLRLAAASLYLQISPPMVDQARAKIEEVMPSFDLVGTDLHRQQLLAVRAQLAFEEGRFADARTLFDALDGQPLLLSFRDRVRAHALRGQLLIVEGQVDAGTRVLQELATQAQEAHNVELAAELWRNLASTLSGVYSRSDRAEGAQSSDGTVTGSLGRSA